MCRRSVHTVVLGLSVALCATAYAADPAPTADTTATAPAAALQAFIDPVTGALREATAEDLAKAAAANPIPLRDDAELRLVQHANGMVSVVLDESFMSTSVAKIGPDGRVITGCVSTREEYDAFFSATPAIAEEEVR
jgi:hypothetical protein